MAVTKFAFNSQIGHREALIKDYWLRDFELSRFNEDPVIGDSLDSSSQSSCPPLACQFCPVAGQEHKFAVADELGYIVLYDTRQTLSHSTFESFAAHDNAIFDISWMWTEPRVVTASGDQTLALIDMTTCETVDTFKAHTGSVKSVDVLANSNAVFASGSRDGHIMIWDSRCNKKGDTIPPVNIIRNAHSTPIPVLHSASKGRRKAKLGPALDSQQSVTIVLFQSDVNLVSSGAVDGVVKLWDLRKNYCICGNEPLPKVSFPYAGNSERKCGFSSMTFDSYKTRLYVNCTDDVIYEYDFATYNPTPMRTYSGHQNKTFYVKSALSPDNGYLLTGSSDSAAYIYQIGRPDKPAVVLKEHKNEVTGVSWSPYDFTKLVTLSDDNMVRMWRLVHRAEDLGPVEIYGKAELCINKSVVTPMKKVVDNFTKSPRPLSSPVANLKRKLTPSRPGSNKKPNITKSPSIQQWFNRELPKRKIPDDWPSSPSKFSKLLSPNKLLSPRKIEISPMKSPDMRNRIVPFGMSETTPRANSVRYDSPRTGNCKRKLIKCGEDEFASPNKKQFTDELNNRGSVNDTSLKDQQSLNDASFPLRNQLPHNCAGIIEAVTPKSNRSRILSDSTLTQSPTANLPNLVVDGPKQKIHLKSLESGKENSQLDWLTRFRLEKHGCVPFGNYSPTRRKNLIGSDTATDSQTDCSSVESSPAKLTGIATLGSPVRGMSSILKFFPTKQK